MKGGFQRNLNFSKILKYSLMFLLSSFLVSIITYVDKLLIYPLLGAASVSIYYVSTLLGRTIELALNPINSVLLSYLSSIKNFKIKYYIYILSFLIVIGIVGYIIIILISHFALELIYPQFVDDAMVLIPITTATIIFTIISNVLNSINIRFKNINNQVIINVIHIIFYISLSIPLLTKFGLIGFSIGILISAFIKLVSVIGIYFLSKNNYKEKEILI
jgi:O-antigen/teichoic acid export membrane protein